MGKLRVVAVCLVALLAFGVLDASCGSDGSSKANAQRTAQAKAKAKKARATAVRKRQQAARRRAAQRAAVTVPPATFPPVTVPPVTVPPVTVPRVRTPSPAKDLAAIKLAFRRVNAGFRKGVAAGIVSSIYANYWVATRHYNAAQCTRFEANRGEGVVAESFTINPATLKRDLGWVDPATGRAAIGRVYTIGVTDTQRLVRSKRKRTEHAVIRASVIPSGQAFLFFRCS